MARDPAAWVGTRSRPLPEHAVVAEEISEAPQSLVSAPTLQHVVDGAPGGRLFGVAGSEEEREPGFRIDDRERRALLQRLVEGGQVGTGGKGPDLLDALGVEDDPGVVDQLGGDE